jgi:hypothetical protein
VWDIGWEVTKNSIFTFVLLERSSLLRGGEASSQSKNTRVAAARKKNLHAADLFFAVYR